MFHHLQSIKPLPDFMLFAQFEDGSKRKYDVKPLFEKWKVFNELRNGDLFNKVYVDAGGYGIVWNDDIDLSAEDIYELGEVVN